MKELKKDRIRDTRRLNSIWRKGVCTLLLAALLGTAAVSTAFADGENTFVQGTSVNGLGISGMTVEEASERIEGFYAKEYKLTIKERNQAAETIQGSDIGFAVGLPEGFLKEILDQQNAAGRLSGPDVDNKHRVSMANTYSEEALTAKINGLNCISGSDIPITADAAVSAYQEGEPFVIIPEVRGRNVNQERVTEVVVAAVKAGDTEVDLDASGCYYEPQVTADSEELKALCDTMNRCREMSITYTFGEESEILEPSVLCSWITGTADGRIQLDQEKAAGFVKALAEKYDTSGTERVFHTATGRDVTVTGPYGWKLDQAAELAALNELVQTGESQTREPQYAAAAAERSAQEWGNTYAEVDLTGQHAYMIQDGQLVWETPCVTGSLDKHCDTPAGLYSLTYKERDRVLRGAKQADGTYEYETPVSYWMPFNGGIGFHDANWRGSFGGTIYQTNGSHGCVNLPPEKAKILYDLVYKGMPVICYQ